jgi:thiamine pyrophosphokinase
MDALVFAGGDPIDARWPAVLPLDGWIVAADSGLEHVYALGRRADVVVGDMDSVSAAALERAVAEGAAVERYPADKDATDLELALDAVRLQGAARVTVVGAGGGRLDHFLANLLLFAAPQWAAFELHVLIGGAHAVVIRAHDRAELRGAPGSIVSLLPAGGPVDGVRTTGLRWPLAGDQLPPGSTRGVSNEMTASVATVSIDAGALLAIQPDADPGLVGPTLGGN